VFKFVEFLQKDENAGRIDLLQFETVRDLPPRKTKYIQLDNRIRNIVNDFGNRTVLGYLRALAHNLTTF